MALTKISRSLLDTGISDSSDATAITIDSSENVFVGSGTSNGISGGTAGLQVSGAGFKGTISASRHDNNAYGSSLMLGKSRNTSVGSNTIVQDDDAIGAVTFFADDGTNLDSRVAEIVASVDGTPGENDTPGRLTFLTTSDGSAAPSERVRIDSNGDFLVRQTASAVYDTNSGADVRQFWGNQFSGANNTNSKVIIGSATALPLVGGATLNASSKFIVNSYIGFGSSDQTAGGEDGYMAFYTSSGGGAGTEKMRIDNSGNIGIGTTTINSGTLGTSNTFLEVAAGTSAGSGTLILSRNTSTNDVELGGIRFVNANNADDDGLDADGKLVAAISARSATSDSNAGDDSGADLYFYTKPEAGNYAQRMRVSSAGAFFLYDIIGFSGANSDVRYDTASGQIYYQTSSERYKSEITNLEDSLNKIESLRPVRFKDNHTQQFTTGLIAEEVVNIIPEVVFKKDIDGFDEPQPEGINYSDITPFLIKAIQEQQEQIEALQSEINTLKGE